MTSIAHYVFRTLSARWHALVTVAATLPPLTRQLSRSHRASPRALVVALASMALLLAGPGLNAAYADSKQGKNVSKIARDLDDEITNYTPSKRRWAREISGIRHVQSIIVSNSSDPEMRDLRAQVLRHGGTVQAVHRSMRAITVRMPGRHVRELSRRADVISISPNRETRRTFSALESITGSLSGNVRTYSSSASYTGVDGSGIGIAVLDSGVMKSHDAFDNGLNRVKRNVNMHNASTANWGSTTSTVTSLQPGSSALAAYENIIAADAETNHDPFGHGTHVASVAAGRYFTSQDSASPDISGIAPMANIYDVRVLDGLGSGTVSDALAGIEWVIYHAKEYNIRVMNLSLAGGSTESWLTDPLCVAVRNASAAGITVVVAAGNYGTKLGKENYGTIGSPGNDPSVITVGAVNFKGTTERSDDTVNNFSSRGPTRGALVDAAGVRQVDNLLKPDLVAPGNKIIGAAATANDTLGWNFLGSFYRDYYVTPLGIQPTLKQTVMQMSGTSIAAPAVTGAVALMLQANPGLTPPLIKAILQYSAQPIPGANLLQQGAGLLNVDGAIRLARVLRTDINAAVDAGTISAGDSLLASDKTMPSAISTINGQTFNWSRIVYVGGNQMVSGQALFTKFQPLWDQRLVWASNRALRQTVNYWPSDINVPANTFVSSITSAPAPNQTMLTGGVRHATSLAGPSSLVSGTGAFLPTATLSAWLRSGSGYLLANGVILS